MVEERWFDKLSKRLIPFLSLLIVGAVLGIGIFAYTSLSNRETKVEQRGPVIQRIGSPCRSAYRAARNKGATKAEAALVAARDDQCVLQGVLNNYALCVRFPQIDLTAKCRVLEHHFASGEVVAGGGSSNPLGQAGGPKSPPHAKRRRPRGNPITTTPPVTTTTSPGQSEICIRNPRLPVCISLNGLPKLTP